MLVAPGKSNFPNLSFCTQNGTFVFWVSNFLNGTFPENADPLEHSLLLSRVAAEQASGPRSWSTGWAEEPAKDVARAALLLPYLHLKHHLPSTDRGERVWEVWHSTHSAFMYSGYQNGQLASERYEGGGQGLGLGSNAFCSDCRTIVKQTAASPVKPLMQLAGGLGEEVCVCVCVTILAVCAHVYKSPHVAVFVCFYFWVRKLFCRKTVF